MPSEPGPPQGPPNEGACGRPASRFLAALALAGALVLAVAWLRHRSLGIGLEPALAAALHGVCALALARLLGLRGWWLPAALLFAPAALVCSGAGLPAWIWGLLLLLALGVFWGVLRSRVPLYLTNRATWEAVAALLPPGPCRVLDAGAGLGGLLAFLARRRPDAVVEGVELAPLTWLACRLRLLPGRARVRLGDLAAVPLAPYDLVFAFLSPEPMPALLARARREMRPGSRLVSCEFGVPGEEPDRRIPVPGGRELLVWELP